MRGRSVLDVYVPVSGHKDLVTLLPKDHVKPCCEDRVIVPSRLYVVERWLDTNTTKHYNNCRLLKGLLREPY
jgi:hypothetical protein